MTNNNRTLLLIGSAKKPRSNSQSLGSYLMEKLEEKGAEIQTILIHRALRSEGGIMAMLKAVEAADLVVLAFPLYIDSLPANVIKALEEIAWYRESYTEPRAQRFMAIVNCGLPEASHNDTAITICRRFASEADFTWAGSLSLGGGESINEKPLAEVHGMVRNVIKALDLTTDALARSEPVPQKAVDLMAKPMMPNWFYRMAGSLRWWRDAGRAGVRQRLKEQPLSPGPGIDVPEYPPSSSC